MALESSVGVCSNALATGLRLSKRTETHSREHLWSLWLCCFCSSSRSLLLAPSHAHRRRWPPLFYLPVVLLTPRWPITLLRTRAGVALKGLAQFSTAMSDGLKSPLTQMKITRHGGEKITGPPTFPAILGMSYYSVEITE